MQNKTRAKTQNSHKQWEVHLTMNQQQQKGQEPKLRSSGFWPRGMVGCLKCILLVATFLQ